MPAKIRYTSLPKQGRYFTAFTFSRLTIGLFALGFLAGYLGGNLLREHLYEPVLLLFQNTVNALPSLDINRNDVFFYCLKENLKLFLLLVFFALTNVWRFYYIGFTLYTGFTQGLFCSFCIILSGIAGILQYLCFLLPQMLLLAPVFIVLISHLEMLHSGLFSPENNDSQKSLLHNSKKRQLVLSGLPFLLICILLLGVGALLEGYLNIPLLKYYLAK